MTTTHYVIPAIITSVDFKRRLVTSYFQTQTARQANQSTEVYEDLGWFVHFEGSHESLYLGTDKPSLVPGEEVEIVIRRKQLA